MRYDDICSVVAQRATLDRAQADRVVKATLQALAEQADPQALEAVLAQLPAEFTKSIDRGQRGTRRSMDEFLVRVASLDNTTAPQVRRPVLAVFAALQAAVGHDTFHGVVEALGEQFTALLPPPAELLDRNTFLDAVRDRAGLETFGEAETAARDTLAALAERVTAGQAIDLAGFLPHQLRPHLRPEHEHARPFDYSEFLALVATQRAAAEARAGAVLATLREAAPEREIQHTLEQLPNDLARLFT